MILRENQKLAVNVSVNNNYENGVHLHATGTGKSIIILELIKQYNSRYPSRNIVWLCETPSILMEQFNNIKKNGYGNILTNFDIFKFFKEKQKDWYNSVNTNKFWNKFLVKPKPFLLIINRAFLTSNMNYKKITNSIHLIIHDECHTIQNKTTTLFYKYIVEKDNPNCIGLSATPTIDIDPYRKIHTNYNIYEACKDNVILSPKVYWLTSENSIKPREYLEILENNVFVDLPYRKILVWVGIIDKCNTLSKQWKSYLPNYDIFVDTSVDSEGYDLFKDKEQNSILFCASKHREGSDISNLDCCVFMDKVQNRNSKTFIQSMGRVLRKDELNKKQFGVIVDFHAKNAITICERINKFIEIPPGINPWIFNDKTITLRNKNITLYNLQLNIRENIKFENISLRENLLYSDIRNYFARDFINNDAYNKRINDELNVLKSQNVIGYLLRALEILDMVGDIPHVTRGSCGSSLICYLLTISHVDPIKYNICFERFLNKYRKSLPDIDFDFPYNKRDDIFLKIYQKWPNKIARISNHVYYHDKSASREALRILGYKKRIPKDQLDRTIDNLPIESKQQFDLIKGNLMNSLKNYSLHCGGILYFEEGIPEELILKKSLLSQIVLNKKDIAKTKLFKIDILSSRALAQINYIYNAQEINFETIEHCDKTYELLCSGDNIGLILAESPLIRKAFLKIQPKTVEDIALCLALIRPAANLEDNIIYDDDIIELIHNTFKCSYSLADKYRKELLNKTKSTIEECKQKYNMTDEFYSKVLQFQKYSFCKSHAMSYAQLIYKSAYSKVHYPKRFWKGTFKHCVSNYNNWVYPYEASAHHMSYMKTSKHTSVYCKINKQQIDNIDKILYAILPKCYLEKTNRVNEYTYHGIIANVKFNYKRIVLHICFGDHIYYTMSIDKKDYVDKKIEVTGTAHKKDYKQLDTISIEFI